MNQDRINELEQKLRKAQGVDDKPEVKPQTTLEFPDNHLEEDPFDKGSAGDEVDQASRLELEFIAHSLKAQQEAMKPQTHPDFDGETCLECGDDIPQIRLDMGRIYCVHCQDKREKLQKIRGY